jgi:hypothetical protein
MLHTTKDPHRLTFELEQAHYLAHQLHPSRGVWLLLLIRWLSGITARLSGRLYVMNSRAGR